MRQRILDECSQRGTCPLNRREFDEAFTGCDLTIQVRAANDFAQQHGLAFARSTGDQLFLFSRLPKVEETPQRNNHGRQPAKQGRRSNRHSRGQPKSRNSTNRPFGRSF
jgi:hypothetical protein